MHYTSKPRVYTRRKSSAPIEATCQPEESDWSHFQTTGSAKTIARSCGLLSFFNKKDSKYRKLIRYIVSSAVELPRTKKRFHDLKRVKFLKRHQLEAFARGLSFQRGQLLDAEQKESLHPRESEDAQGSLDKNPNETTSSNAVINETREETPKPNPPQSENWGVRLLKRKVKDLERELDDARAASVTHEEFLEWKFRERRSSSSALETENQFLKLEIFHLRKQMEISQETDHLPIVNLSIELSQLKLRHKKELENTRALLFRSGVDGRQMREYISRLDKLVVDKEDLLADAKSEIRSLREELNSVPPPPVPGSLPPPKPDELVVRKNVLIAFSRALQQSLSLNAKMANEDFTQAEYFKFANKIVNFLAVKPVTTPTMEVMMSLREKGQSYQIIEFDKVLIQLDKLIDLSAGGRLPPIPGSTAGKK